MHADGHGRSGHEHDGDGHAGHRHGVSGRGLSVAIVLNAGLGIAQIAAGIVFVSVAVLADAGHQLVDAFGLAIGWIALRLARRPADNRRTWGWGRADAFGAQLSSVVLLASLAWVVYESILRLIHPASVAGVGVLVVGATGVLVNGGSLYVVGHGSEALSLRAARLHLIADLAGSAALIVTGAIVAFTGWDRLDPIVSLVLSVLLVRSTVALLRQSSNVLLDQAPTHLDVDQIVDARRAQPGVIDVHHVHLWTVASGVTALSAHVEIEGERSVHDAQAEVQLIEALVAERFGIGHTTLQLECHPCAAPAHE